MYLYLKTNYTNTQNCPKDGERYSVNQYYLGFPSRAYTELEKGLSIVNEFLILPANNTSHTNRDALFRVRLGNNQMYSRRDMFHIPFEKREYVKTQRYSIPGLPCLYLGNSIYVCWEEMRRPEISNMQVCRYELNHQIKVLDLSFLSTSFIQSYERLKSEMNLLDWFGKYIVTFPLLVSCSIATKNDDATFKPEHIVPQLLLQWVSQTHSVDGIKFFSTRTDNKFEKFIGANEVYVFPVKKIKTTGHCEYLIERTKLTEAISWQILSIINPSMMAQTTSQEDFKKRSEMSMPSIWALELLPGKPVNYFQTTFGKMEIELCKMEATQL